MSVEQPRAADLLAPLVVLGVVVAMVSTGFARGFWAGNLHNGALALAFAGVAAWTLLARPGQREAWIFAAVGVLEAFLFLGRQIAYDSAPDATSWWGWFGVWPLALTLGVLTWAVLSFPEGSFASPRWRSVTFGVLGLAAVLSLVSALWPVEYDAAGVDTRPPFQLGGRDSVQQVWDVVAHPAYAVFQVLWMLGLLSRWRRANGILRSQIAVLGAGVGLATIALLVGLAIWSSPRLGLLATPLIPIAAGWSMVSLSLSRVVEETRASGGLENLSPRENEVLDLMAQGLSNKAISEELHLSLKTVEPIVSSIFVKLGLPPGSTMNRRVLAVRALLTAK